MHQINIGELSIMARTLRILSPALKRIPDRPMDKTEIRFRKRHLDLLTNVEARQILRTRSNILNSIRSFLHNNDFVEVETPILLSGGVSGAAAEPFKTHHNEMEMDMKLRIGNEKKQLFSTPGEDF